MISPRSCPTELPDADPDELGFTVLQLAIARRADVLTRTYGVPGGLGREWWLRAEAEVLREFDRAWWDRMQAMAPPAAVEARIGPGLDREDLPNGDESCPQAGTPSLGRAP